jgi:hypothetical protein
VDGGDSLSVGFEEVSESVVSGDVDSSDVSDVGFVVADLPGGVFSLEDGSVFSPGNGDLTAGGFVGFPDGGLTRIVGSEGSQVDTADSFQVLNSSVND